MATYVLVHGGGHGGWCYQRVARLLRAAGHEVYAPTLTGLGERAHLLSPEVDLDLHIRDVAAVMEYEDPTRDPELIAEARAGGRLWDIDTGHDLMITEPRRVADALLQVAAHGG
jgi:alpha-beta hydrolase superfamily lysophospholipase